MYVCTNLCTNIYILCHETIREKKLFCSFSQWIKTRTQQALTSVRQVLRRALGRGVVLLLYVVGVDKNWSQHAKHI